MEDIDYSRIDVEYINTDYCHDIEDEEEKCREKLYKDIDGKMLGFYEKYNLGKSMKLINKMEGNPISEQKIERNDILVDVAKGKLKASEGKRALNYSEKLHTVIEKNPFVLDNIIL